MCARTALWEPRGSNPPGPPGDFRRFSSVGLTPRVRRGFPPRTTTPFATQPAYAKYRVASNVCVHAREFQVAPSCYNGCGARLVSVARLGGSRQTRNHPNELPTVAGPLHRRRKRFYRGTRSIRRDCVQKALYLP